MRGMARSRRQFWAVGAASLCMGLTCEAPGHDYHGQDRYGHHRHDSHFRYHAHGGGRPQLHSGHDPTLNGHDRFRAAIVPDYPIVIVINDSRGAYSRRDGTQATQRGGDQTGSQNDGSPKSAPSLHPEFVRFSTRQGVVIVRKMSGQAGAGCSPCWRSRRAPAPLPTPPT